MSLAHRNVFEPGLAYSPSCNLKAGFQRDRVLTVGSRLCYREFKYSPYDGCYVYYFQVGESSEVIELWIPEDTSVAEIRSQLRAL